MIWMNTKTGEVADTLKEVVKATIENFRYYKIVTLHWVRIKA
jgi:hypothetical protein